ncbi:MAG: peptidoglycan DD-metalloendopeptidase family protein, partial [Acetivibrio ethanolgignens]
EIEKPEAEITEVEAPETKVPESQEPVSQKEQPEENKEPEAEKQPKKETAPEVSQVMSGADSVKNLSFKEEEGLIWPVVGDVLLKYSMDKSIYFKTLAQYKVNPAVVIAAKEDTEVLSAAKCVVTDVSESEETGVTLTATLGDGYEVVYGQLKEVKAKVGDTIERGSVIGKIAKPTKYYVAEGTNLYFAVLQDGKPVDPLLLLE